MDMIKFAEKTRTTTFFRDYAIARIKVAYRCMEYLKPDSVFPPDDLNDVTKTLINNRHFEEAAENIIEECDVDIRYSSYFERLKEDTIELLQHLYIKSLKVNRHLLEERREQLLKELHQVEQELSSIE